MGFDIASRRSGAPGDGVSRVTRGTTNVTRGCQPFRRTFDEVGEGYPDIERDYGYIDAFMQWITRNPEHS